MSPERWASPTGAPCFTVWAAAVAWWSQVEVRRDPRCHVVADVGAGTACGLPHCYAGKINTGYWVGSFIT